MYNSELAVSDEDIDARLARYNEVPKEMDIKNSYQGQLYKDDKSIKEQYLICEKSKHKDNFNDISEWDSKFRDLPDWNLGKKTFYEEKKTEVGNKLSQTSTPVSKFHFKNASTSEQTVDFLKHSDSHIKRVIKQKDQSIVYSCKINRNEFSDKHSGTQRNRTPAEHNLLSDNSSGSLTSVNCFRNIHHAALSPLRKEQHEFGYELNNFEKSSSFSPSVFIHADNLENNTSISKTIVGLHKVDGNFEVRSSQSNGARRKNLVRDSYHYSEIGTNNIKEKNYNRVQKSEMGGENEFKNSFQSNGERRKNCVTDLYYHSYIDRHNFKAKKNNREQKSEMSARNEFENSSPYSSHYSNTGHLDYGNYEYINNTNPDSSITFEFDNHSIPNKFERKKEQNLNDSYLISRLKEDVDCETKVKYRYDKDEGNENDIVWKKQSRTSNDEISNTFLDSDFRQIINRKSNIDSFTMHDARRMAPKVQKCHVDSNFVRQSMSSITDEETMFNSKRRCWSRFCFSNTKHSHALNTSQDLYSRKNRNAIVNSMRSPQYTSTSKKKSLAEYWSSFWKASASRFELWNRTLKKIEGQFGTGVVSYFVFLRWLILLNFVIFILYFLLIILPYSAFVLLPHQNIKTAPNTTLLTDEYLEQFPKFKSSPFTRKIIGFENASFNLEGDLLSNLGTLLDNFVPDEILDLTGRYDKRNFTGEERHRISLFCEERYEKEMANSTKQTFSFLQDFLQGTGWLQSTILFLGYYPDRDVSYFGLSYNLPVSFLAVLIVSFFLSLILMVQYSSHGIQENVLTQKSNYLTFSNILFCSWDYCIEDKKTADIRHKSIICEIKSNLAEEHRKLEVSHWSSEKRMRVYMLRAIINIIVITALFGSFYLIYRVVNFQLEKQRQNALKDGGAYTLFIQFLPPLVITALNIIMPIIFYTLVKFEMYNNRMQINIALFRIVFLRLASVFVLVSSLYQQITCEPKDLCKAGLSEYCTSPICWETYVGQQLYKLVITDFLVYIFMFIGYDLPRDFIVQKCKCKVTEVVGRQVFDIPSQVLSLVYSQTLCWLGMFYSPLLPGISVLKFLIIFYIKKVVVLKHCVPAPVLYKASRSNSIFMTILMISLFVVTMIYGYSLTSVEPSPGCSPFRQYFVMIEAVSDAIKIWSPNLVRFLTFIFSFFFFVPAFLLLSLIIYYYWTVIVAHKQMTKVLKAQIAVEGQDKKFLLNRLAEAARQAIS